MFFERAKIHFKRSETREEKVERAKRDSKKRSREEFQVNRVLFCFMKIKLHCLRFFLILNVDIEYELFIP